MLRTRNHSRHQREGIDKGSPPNNHAGDYTGGGGVQGRVAVTVAGEVTINMLLGEGMWQCAGLGGGTASTMAAVGNDVPSTNRSAAVAFFARMDTVMWRWGDGCCNDSKKDNGCNVVALAATRAGI